MRHLIHGAERMAKAGYVAVLGALAGVARRIGLQSWLEHGARRGTTRHWLASLLSIYDIDGLIRLDVPWWTYGAIDRVDAFLATKPCRVFEYGSGASTIWLARRAAMVASVEHDGDWHGLVAGKVTALAGLCPVDLRHIPATLDPEGCGHFPSQKAVAQGLDFEAYAKAIDDAGGPFDLIVVDGRVREACLVLAIPHLAPGGIVVFDNSHRARYRAAIAASGLVAERFRGRAPALPYGDETTLLTRPGP